MAITWFDLVLLVIMLISAFLAMVRGFMREVLSIGSWLIAAIAAVYLAKRVAPLVKSFVNVGDTPAMAIAGVAVFLVVLVILAVVTVQISDKITDSRVGALDRTLGFMFGLARGLILVTVAYVFFDWMVIERAQPDGVKHAKSIVVLKATRNWLYNLLPDDVESTISKYTKGLKRPKQDDQSPPDTNP